MHGTTPDTLISQYLNTAYTAFCTVKLPTAFIHCTHTLHSALINCLQYTDAFPFRVLFQPPFQIPMAGGAPARPSVPARGRDEEGRIFPRTRGGRTHVGSSSRAPVPDDDDEESEAETEAESESSEEETGGGSSSGSDDDADDAPGPLSRKRTRTD